MTPCMEIKPHVVNCDRDIFIMRSRGLFRLNRNIREVQGVQPFSGRIASYREKNKPTSSYTCKYFEKTEGELDCMSFPLLLNRRINCVF